MQRSRTEPFLAILHCVVALILYSQPHWAFLKDLLWDLETKALPETAWIEGEKQEREQPRKALKLLS